MKNKFHSLNLLILKIILTYTNIDVIITLTTNSNEVEK